MRGIITGIVMWLALTGVASSQSVVPHDSTQPPTFPTPEEALTITRPTRVVTFPRWSINVGITKRHFDTDGLAQSYANFEATGGISGPNYFSESTTSFTFGLRMHTTRSFALWWEYAYGGDATHNKATISSIGISVVITLYPFGENGFAVSLGTGPVMQSLNARRNYYIELEDGGTLEYIKLSTGQQLGMPIIVLLEAPASFTSPLAVYASGRYIVGGTLRAVRSVTYFPGDPVDAKISIDMDNFLLSVGIVIRL